MAAALRVAICFTGTWRSFVLPEVHLSLAANLSAALGAEGAEVAHFYVVDSAGVSLEAVLPGLAALPARSLVVDRPPPPAPPCFRARGLVVTVLVQTGQIAQCFDLVLEDERASGRRWDWIVRSRLDLQFTQPLLPIQRYDPEAVWVPGVMDFKPNVVSWGFRQMTLFANDHLYLVPRTLVQQFLEPFRDFCPSDAKFAHLCWTPILEYTLLYSLLEGEVPVRFIYGGGDFGFFVNRGLLRPEAGFKGASGTTDRAYEVRLRWFASRQLLAFGGNTTGVQGLPSIDAGVGGVPSLSGMSNGEMLVGTAARVPRGEIRWRDDEAATVVLSPGDAFRDSVVLRAASTCLLPGAGAASVAEESFLQVRIYRPVDPDGRFWRFVGASGDLFPALAALAPSGGCPEALLGSPLVAMAGDVLAYVVRGRFVAEGPAASAPLRVAQGLAAIGEFDDFRTMLQQARGIALQVRHEHFPLTQVRPHCFPSENSDEVREERLFSYDFCCSMETFGPGGHWSCWDGDGGYRGASFSYTTCCIAEENFLGIEGVLGSDSKVSTREMFLAVSAAIRKRKELLHAWAMDMIARLVSPSALFPFSTPGRVLRIFSRLQEPLRQGDEAGFQVEPPYLLPAVLRFPADLCELMLHGVDGAGDTAWVLQASGLTPREFADRCPAFIVLIGPEVAGAMEIATVAAGEPPPQQQAPAEQR